MSVAQCLANSPSKAHLEHRTVALVNDFVMPPRPPARQIRAKRLPLAGTGPRSAPALDGMDEDFQALLDDPVAVLDDAPEIRFFGHGLSC